MIEKNNREFISLLHQYKTMEHQKTVEHIIKLLYHGISHMKKKTKFDLQIAMISIDNTVELCLRTFLGIDELCEFPVLVGIFRMKAPDNITKELIDDILGFHKHRNGAYHKIKKKEIPFGVIYAYASIASTLISKIFNRLEEHLFIEIDENAQKIENFYKNWQSIYERLIIFYFDVTEIHDPNVDEFNESLDTSSYHGIINEKDISVLREIERLTDEIRTSGRIKSIDKLEDYTKYLKELHPRLDDEISEYYEYENLNNLRREIRD